MIPALTVPSRKRLVDGRHPSGGQSCPPPATSQRQRRRQVSGRSAGLRFRRDRQWIGCTFQEGRQAHRPVCGAPAMGWGWLQEFLGIHAEQFAHLFEHIQPLRPRQRLIGFFLIATIAVEIVIVGGAHQTYLSPKSFLKDPGARLFGLAAAIHSGRRIAVATVRPPRAVGAGPDPHFITIRLRFDSEHLVSSYLRKSESKDLTGRSSHFQLTATIIVEGEQGSLHGTGNGRSGKSPGYMVPVATVPVPELRKAFP